MKCQLILTLRIVASGGMSLMSLFQKQGRPHQLDHTLKGQLTLHCRFAFRSNALRCDKNDKPGKLSREAACRGKTLPLGQPDSPVNLVSIASSFLGSS